MFNSRGKLVNSLLVVGNISFWRKSSPNLKLPTLEGELGFTFLRSPSDFGKPRKVTEIHEINQNKNEKIGIFTYICFYV